MRAIKFIFSSALITFLLLAAVVLVHFIISAITPPVSGGSDGYSLKDIIIGVSNEGLRAVLLCYLFTHIKGAGSSFLHAIKFNLIFVALIGSLWLIGIYGMFELKNPTQFLFADTFIFIIQGIVSGIALQILYKKQFI